MHNMTIRKSVLFVALLAAAGCGDPDPQESFSNSLRFGTGLGGNGFDLVGEAKTFSLAKLDGKPLYFRLESVEDIDGRFVRLYFDDLTNKDFTAVQEYGHITLSSFAVTNAGTYDVKGFYVQTVIDIGKETLVASATLGVTP